jgi:ribosome maturation factor RimP
MQLVELIEQAVAGLGYQLVDFEMSPHARLLREFIDRLPEKGSVNIEDCSTVSNHLSHLLTVENVDYDRLEVSSPGLDRPLKKPADWQRFAGQDVQIKLRIPIGRQRNFAGRIIGLEGDAAMVTVEGATHAFLLNSIEKARLVPKI